MMKYFIGLLLSLLSISAFSQNEADKDYCGYGDIPQWVKNKTTPEEYKIWETLSPYYLINYSCLKNRNLKGRAKETFYENMRNLCDSVNSGKLPPKGMRIGYIDIVLDSLSAYSTESVRCIEKKYVIYSSLDGYDAHAELTLDYTINQRGIPRIVNWSVHAISFSGLDVDIEECFFEEDMKKTYGPRLYYVAERKMFKGYYCGYLSFTNAEGKKFREHMNVNFYLTP